MRDTLELSARVRRAAGRVGSSRRRVKKPHGLVGAAIGLIVVACGTSQCARSEQAARLATTSAFLDPNGASGSRYFALDDITPASIRRLEIAWTYRTGESRPEFATRETPKLETTPVVVDDAMYISTPLGRVIALDAETGAERWIFDARINRDENYGDFTNRGVAVWDDPLARSGATCSRRVYLASIDARLFSIDATTGKLCDTFGENGSVDLRRGLRIAPFEYAAYQVTSAPLVVGDIVISGSAIADNSRPAPASGEVRAFDARTGALRWTWDPIPQDPADPAFTSWENGSAARTGSANVWSRMIADSERGLIFVPTSSPAPDYYGGLRPGSNRYANSIVALRADTGHVVWHFQTVHHDLWDYDNAAPPAMVTVERGTTSIPAVLQATKTGQLFAFHRDSGEPVFPVEERRVPPSDIPGEHASSTQPFSVGLQALSPHALQPDDAWGPTPADRQACRELIAALRNEGIFTPPSLRGTLVMPSNIGGAHWGGVAVDPVRQKVVVPVNRHASMVQLIEKGKGFDRDRAEAESDRLSLGYEYNEMEGTPYAMRRRVLRSPSGFPCTPPPFGALVAIDLRTGTLAWQVPLGTTTVPPRKGRPTTSSVEGALNLGGPIATAGGLVFIGATREAALRAFDTETGAQLWRHELPGSAQATPMAFRGLRSGRPFVAIAAAPEHIVVFSLR